MHAFLRLHLIAAGLTLGLGGCSGPATSKVDLASVQTAPVQPVTATPLAPPPGPAADAGSAAGWTGAQRILNSSADAGTAVSLYRTLCDVGDASACMMSSALDPRLSYASPGSHEKLMPSR